MKKFLKAVFFKLVKIHQFCNLINIHSTKQNIFTHHITYSFYSYCHIFSSFMIFAIKMFIYATFSKSYAEVPLKRLLVDSAIFYEITTLFVDCVSYKFLT